MNSVIYLKNDYSILEAAAAKSEYNPVFKFYVEFNNKVYKEEFNNFNIEFLSIVRDYVRGKEFLGIGYPENLRKYETSACVFELSDFNKRNILITENTNVALIYARIYSIGMFHYFKLIKDNHKPEIMVPALKVAIHVITNVIGREPIFSEVNQQMIGYTINNFPKNLANVFEVELFIAILKAFEKL